ncbi:MAG: hypothetical protein C0183_02065 [Roseiflexus castenholzii]|uniref:hypothetical protein n=1 Tax=Roseiflexus castenholzii TaxID=120962 RepID=UPI000CB30AC5|nr:MAG: hypothetical protein C0183_02065 [Roseiflexus castenholzii]
MTQTVINPPRVEVTSNGAQFDLAGTPLYVIVDTFERCGQSLLRVPGYERTGAAYRPIAPTERRSASARAGRRTTPFTRHGVM